MIYVFIVILFIAGGALLSCIFGVNEEEREFEDKKQAEYLNEWSKRKKGKNKSWK